MATYFLALLLVFLILMFGMAISVSFGGHKVAYATYQWFGEALNYGAWEANQDGDLTQVSVRTSAAKRAFAAVFAEMTGTTYSNDSFIPRGSTSVYPGPITLDSFVPVEPGDPVPYGTASQPGYVATISVPVFGGTYPVVGEQYVSIPMRCFAVVQSVEGQVN